ncbi:MAG: sugar phosphate isomerase/epimerase family protein [Pirellulales bacterium]
MAIPHRRRFLQQSALAVAAISAPFGQARGIEPIQRNGQAKFKFSLAAYSYRDLLTGEKPPLTLADFVDDCAKLQLDGTELTSYYFPANPSDEYLRQIKEQCFRLGLDISGTAVGNDFCHPPGEARDEQIQLVKTWVDRAEILGAPVIRIFSGAAREGLDEAEARRLAIEGIEECCEYAGRHGVYLALENHGGLTAKAEGMLEIVKAVRSPWFGVNVDSGNFHSSDVYAELASIAPYALNVQIKVVVQPEGAGRQPSDYSRLASIFRDTGYRGYIVLEFEEKGDPRTACPRHLEDIRKAFT